VLADAVQRGSDRAAVRAAATMVKRARQPKSKPKTKAQVTAETIANLSARGTHWDDPALGNVLVPSHLAFHPDHSVWRAPCMRHDRKSAQAGRRAG